MTAFDLRILRMVAKQRHRAHDRRAAGDRERSWR